MEANQVKELRKRLGWTQAKMADWLGVTKARVSQLEKGEKPSGALQKGIDRLNDHLDQVA